MKVLVTAGSTAVPIDQVRSISNIFKGRTGNSIACYLSLKECDVTLITSSEKMLPADKSKPQKVISFKTYDELYEVMEREIKHGGYDVIIHSAAVSDYYVKGAFVLEDEKMVLINTSKKVSSSHDKVFLEPQQTVKIVDLIRDPWNFHGQLIKFKLQVGITDDELLEIAEKSRTDSDADIIVANCLEWSKDRAYIVTENETIDVTRDDLPNAIFELLTKNTLS